MDQLQEAIQEHSQRMINDHDIAQRFVSKAWVEVMEFLEEREERCDEDGDSTSTKQH